MSTELMQLAQEAARKLPKAPRFGLADPALAFTSLVQAWQNYRQIIEVEQTRREEIRARAEVEVTRLREQVGLVREYLRMSFAERRENFERSFSILEAGLANKDDRQIEVALTMIVTLVKESPVKQAVEAMRAIKERAPGQIIDL